MTTPASVSPEEIGTTYTPNAEQVQRAAALRRFNWLYIYTPVIVLSLVALTLVILLLWGVLSPGVEGTSAFVSGLADVVAILFSLPLIVLCAIGPAALLAIVVLAVRRRRDPQATSILERLHVLLWRLDTVTAKVMVKTEELAPRVAEVVIRAHARTAYLNNLFNRVKRIFVRS